MADSENSTILEEIRILKDALSQKSQAQSSTCEVSTSESERQLILLTNPYYSTPESPNHEEYSESENTSRNELLTTSTDSKNVQKLLDINQTLMELYTEAKERLSIYLEECRRKREMLDQRLTNRVKSTPLKHYNWTIGMPYFKTKDSYYAPLNEDAKLKAARGELEIVHLRQSCRWTTRDKNILLRAIRDEVTSQIKTADNNASDDKVVLSSEVKEYIGMLGETEFDWMKIGSTEFQNRHTAEECRVMWNVFLHPDINKTKWTKKEDGQLNVLAKNFERQNWDGVAEKLNTKRTGYQCFIRFNTNSTKSSLKSTMWTKDEDIKLKKIVETLKIGNFIPWGEVASWMPKRTKQQIYYHWMYSVAPYLRKGRFTNEEDETLKRAVAKYGTNFSKISAFVMPQRTSAQLNDHYNTICTREINEKLGKQGRIWDYKDDVKLLGLYEVYGTNWSRIAKEFDNKTRIQLRHRYSALKRYENRGISLMDIPRAAPDDISDEEVDRLGVDDGIEIDDVDKELIDYFRALHQSPQIRSQTHRTSKFYSSQELTDNVRTLYNILQALHVNIISSNFVDQDRLSEKDRQLFHVLNEFCKRSVTNSESNRMIERYRLLMFGPPYPSQENEHFIPPLPFSVVKKEPVSFKKVAKKADQSKSTTIDYVAPENQSIQILPDFTPTITPENLVNVIGDDQDVDFDRMKELLIKRTWPMKKPQKRIYILSPEVLNKSATRSRVGIGNRYVIDNVKSNALGRGSITEMLKYTWDWRNPPLGIDDDINFLHPTKMHRMMPLKTYYYEKSSLMKPNWSILNSYQGILHYARGDKKPLIDVEAEERCKVSYRGKIALDLLKRRFEILFTYPMCMARITIPEGMDKRSSELPIWEDSVAKRTEKRSKGCLTANVKKQRISECENN